MVIVDELHMMGDVGRGYLLELLLAKVLYMVLLHRMFVQLTVRRRKILFCDSAHRIQVIGLSATLANIEDVCQLLSARKYVSDFRPVSLSEFVKIGTSAFLVNKSLNWSRDRGNNVLFCGGGGVRMCVCGGGGGVGQ